MLVVHRPNESYGGERVWGTGGWLNPTEREALDWATLARLSGWGVNDFLPEDVTPNQLIESDWVVITTEAADASAAFWRMLHTTLERVPVLIISRAASPDEANRLTAATSDTGMITGRTLEWTGPGPTVQWRASENLTATALAVSDQAEVWATLEGTPVVAATYHGRSAAVNLGFHPSELRDASGFGTALLRNLLVWGVGRPIAWIEFAGTMVLRIDDPGSAQNVHSTEWAHRELGPDDWEAIGDVLERNDARLTVGYCPGWMDDGDSGRGRFLAGGPDLDRIPGGIYPAPSVVYEDTGGHMPGTVHDFLGEFEAIRTLMRQDLVSVEQHGFTHMHPDGGEWATAPDRYTAAAWYREFGSHARAAIERLSPSDHPLRRGFAELASLSIQPSTLVFPGDEWTVEAIQVALDLGFQAVSSFYTAIRYRDRFLWATHVAAPYLDEPASHWFESELPVIGYFHDRDIAVHGVSWLTAALDQWRSAGACRFIDFRDLLSALSRTIDIIETPSELRVIVSPPTAGHTSHPFSIRVRSQRDLPELAAVELAQQRVFLPIEKRSDGTGLIRIT